MTAITETPPDALERKIDALSEQVAELTRATQAERRRRERLEELIEDGMPLMRSATEGLAVQLEELRAKGYIDFAKAGLGVIDQVVVNFSEEDVQQLGENVVTILETVKEMTQPEVMALLHRMVEAVERQQAAIESEPDAPPSLWQLAGKTRDPAVRRGIGRALNTLAAVSETGSTPNSKNDKQQTT